MSRSNTTHHRHQQKLQLQQQQQQQLQQQQLMAAQQEQMAADTAATELFDYFCLATTMRQILGLHRDMCDLVGLRPGPLNEFYPKLKTRVRSWKAQALWKKFDARAAHRAYAKGTACTGTRVLVIGAGPCGLRTAIEAQLLGAKVVVIEKRDRISRNNVLHLWPFVITDLRNLGAKKFYGKFCAGSIDHISIRQLQCILLKVALLLGVEVHEGVSFERTIEPNGDGCGWRAAVTPADHAVSHYEFDMLIGADGKRNTLEGFRRKEFRGKLAIAITANFINKKTEAEAKAEEISGVAFIFNQSFFKELYHTTGIDLENIVYYKDETHYFVMTAKKHSLIDKGVILQDFADPAGLLAQANVNTDKLLDYAREAAEFSTKYQMPNLEFAVNHYGKPDVAMFDFTSMFAAETSCRCIVRKGFRLLQCLVGDSLLEPFWPTGSGCARGFLSSMDAAYALKLWSNPRNSSLAVLAQRESIYRLLNQTTPENLQRDIGSYTVDPATRYPNLNRSLVNAWQVKHLVDTDDKLVLEQTYMDTNALQPTQVDSPVRRKRRSGDSVPMSAVLLRWICVQLHAYDFVKELKEVSDVFTHGRVLCALINRYRPDLVDYTAIKDLSPTECNEIAFNILDTELHIPRVMSGKDSMELKMIESKVWLNYLEQICEMFRGEIPHVKHPKMDFSELREKYRSNTAHAQPDFSKLLQISTKQKMKAALEGDAATTTTAISATKEAGQVVAVAGQPDEKPKRHRREAAPIAVQGAAAASGQVGATDTPRRAKKRRSAEKTANIEERQKRLQEIEQNRQDRLSKRRQQRYKQTQNFYTSLHMLQANTLLRESADDSPFEDYSIFLYRQQAPEFNDRVKDLERKLLYPDRDRSDIPSALPRATADEQFSDRIKSMEQRISSRNNFGGDKKPKDLMRAIGKIDSTDWNVREIEKKIEQSKRTEIHGPKGREKVPKWSKEQFVARQTKMSKPLRQDSREEEKFREIDQTLKNLDKQLKEGSVLEVGERGRNKVASIAGQFVKKDDTSDEKNNPPTVVAKSSTKVALAFKKQAASEKCHFCKQTVYLMEKITTENLILHRSCLKCHHCHNNLRPGGYAFDRDDPNGRFYCTQHFRLPAKAIRPVVRKPGQRKPTQQQQHAAAAAAAAANTATPTENAAADEPKTPEKLRRHADNVAQLDLLDRGQTPERIEFENTDAMSDGEPSEEHIIDEHEWSGRNFLPESNNDSESDLSSSDESDTESDSDMFEEANDSPLGAQTLQLASDWIGKQNYSDSEDSDDFYDSSEGIADDDGKDDTEGEEFKKARELRREEVRLLPLPANLPTDTETEIKLNENIEINNEQVPPLTNKSANITEKENEISPTTKEVLVIEAKLSDNSDKSYKSVGSDPVQVEISPESPAKPSDVSSLWLGKDQDTVKVAAQQTPLSRTDIEKLEQHSDRKFSAEIEAISEKLYRLNNVVKMNKDLETLAKENLVKSDILKKLTMKEKWLADNNAGNLGNGALGGSTKSLAPKSKFDEKFEKLVEKKPEKGSEEALNNKAKKPNTPIDHISRAKEIVEQLSKVREEIAAEKSQKPLIKKETVAEPMAVTAETVLKTESPLTVEKSSSVDQKPKSPRADRKPLTSNLARNNNLKKSNKLSPNASPHLEKKSKPSGSSVASRSNSFKSNASSSPLSRTSSLKKNQSQTKEAISGGKMQIENILNIVKRMDISKDTKDSETENIDDDDDDGNEKGEMGRMLYDAENKFSQKPNKSMSTKLKEIEATNFAGTMDTIKSQMVMPTVSTQASSSVDLSRYFPNQKQEKNTELAVNKNQKNLKDVDLAKYFPSSPVPQRRASVVTVADKLKKSQTEKAIEPAKPDVKKVPPKRQASLGGGGGSLSLKEHQLDGAVDITKKKVAVTAATATTTKKGNVKIVKKIVPKGTKAKKNLEVAEKKTATVPAVKSDDPDSIFDEILQDHEMYSPSLEYQNLFQEEKSPSEDISDKIERILEETGIDLGLPKKTSASEKRKKLLKTKSLGEGDFEMKSNKLTESRDSLVKEDGDRPSGVQNILKRFESMSSVKSDEHAFKLRRMESSTSNLNKSRESIVSRESDSMSDLEKTMEYLKTEWRNEATNFLQKKRDSFFAQKRTAEEESAAKSEEQKKKCRQEELPVQYRESKLAKFFGYKAKSPEKRKSPQKKKSPDKQKAKSPQKNGEKLKVTTKKVQKAEKDKTPEKNIAAERKMSFEKEKSTGNKTVTERRMSFEKDERNPPIRPNQSVAEKNAEISKIPPTTPSKENETTPPKSLVEKVKASLEHIKKLEQSLSKDSADEEAFNVKMNSRKNSIDTPNDDNRMVEETTATVSRRNSGASNDDNKENLSRAPVEDIRNLPKTGCDKSLNSSRRGSQISLQSRRLSDSSLQEQLEAVQDNTADTEMTNVDELFKNMVEAMNIESKAVEVEDDCSDSLCTSISKSPSVQPVTVRLRGTSEDDEIEHLFSKFSDEMLVNVEFDSNDELVAITPRMTLNNGTQEEAAEDRDHLGKLESLERDEEALKRPVGQSLSVGESLFPTRPGRRHKSTSSSSEASAPIPPQRMKKKLSKLSPSTMPPSIQDLLHEAIAKNVQEEPSPRTISKNLQMFPRTITVDEEEDKPLDREYRKETTRRLSNNSLSSLKENSGELESPKPTTKRSSIESNSHDVVDIKNTNATEPSKTNDLAAKENNTAKVSGAERITQKNKLVVAPKSAEKTYKNEIEIKLANKSPPKKTSPKASPPKANPPTEKSLPSSVAAKTNPNKTDFNNIDRSPKSTRSPSSTSSVSQNSSRKPSKESLSDCAPKAITPPQKAQSKEKSVEWNMEHLPVSPMPRRKFAKPERTVMPPSPLAQTPAAALPEICEPTTDLDEERRLIEQFEMERRQALIKRDREYEQAQKANLPSKEPHPRKMSLINSDEDLERYENFMMEKLENERRKALLHRDREYEQRKLKEQENQEITAERAENKTEIAPPIQSQNNSRISKIQGDSPVDNIQTDSQTSTEKQESHRANQDIQSTATFSKDPSQSSQITVEDRVWPDGVTKFRPDSDEEADNIDAMLKRRHPYGNQSKQRSQSPASETRLHSSTFDDKTPSKSTNDLRRYSPPQSTHSGHTNSMQSLAIGRSSRSSADTEQQYNTSDDRSVTRPTARSTPEEPLDASTRMLLDRSKRLHNRKRDFINERVVERNPYMRGIIDEEALERRAMEEAEEELEGYRPRNYTRPTAARFPTSRAVGRKSTSPLNSYDYISVIPPRTSYGDYGVSSSATRRLPSSSSSSSHYPYHHPLSTTSSYLPATRPSSGYYGGGGGGVDYSKRSPSHHRDHRELSKDSCVQSESESTSPDEVELNSATEISTDSEFDHDEIIRRIREAPKIFIDDTHLRKQPTKVQVKSSVIATSPSHKYPSTGPNQRTATGGGSYLQKYQAQPQVPPQPQFKPLVQVDPTLLMSTNRTPLQNPRPGDYLLNKTASTEGIASKKSLELKKRYLLGEAANGNKIQKSGSTSVLDSKIRSFQSNISECQKLLNPGTEISPSMKTFLDRSKLSSQNASTQNELMRSATSNILNELKVEITIQKASSTASTDNEKENVFVNSKNELNKGMEYSETVNTTLLESMSKKSPSTPTNQTIIETIDLVTPEKKVPKVETPTRIVAADVKSSPSEKDSNKIIDLTGDSPVKSAVNIPDVSKDATERIPDIIEDLKTEKLKGNSEDNQLLLDEEKRDSPEKLIEDHLEHDTVQIQVPTIPWITRKPTDIVSSTTGSSCSSHSSSIEDIQHYILDSTTSPDTNTAGAGGHQVPRVQVHDTSGTLMKIDSLMIIDDKYNGGDTDELLLPTPEVAAVKTSEIEDDGDADVEPVTATPEPADCTVIETETHEEPPPLPEQGPPLPEKGPPKMKPSLLKFDSRNENKIESLKNLPLIVEQNVVDQTKAVKPISLSLHKQKTPDTPTNAKLLSPTSPLNDNDKTPTGDMLSRCSDSEETEATGTGQALTETELSDWTADDCISENFIDMEFMSNNTSKGTIKRNKKKRSSATVSATSKLPSTREVADEMKAAPMVVFEGIDIDDIEFMDTGSEGSCAEAYSATNTALLRNRGYVEFIEPTPTAKLMGSPHIPVPRVATAASSNVRHYETKRDEKLGIDYIEQGAYILQRDDAAVDLLKTPVNETTPAAPVCGSGQMTQSAGSTTMTQSLTDSSTLNEVDDDSMGGVMSQATTTLTTTTTTTKMTTDESEGLTVVTSPLDSSPSGKTPTPHNEGKSASASSSDKNPKTTSQSTGGASSTGLVSSRNTPPRQYSQESAQQMFTEDLSYEDCVRALQQKITQISNARDSLDSRKQRRKSSKGEATQPNFPAYASPSSTAAAAATATATTTTTTTKTVIDKSATNLSEPKPSQTAAPKLTAESNETTSATTATQFHKVPEIPTLTRKLEEITKERTKQKDLIHDLVMDKLQSKKQLNAEKRLHRSRQRALLTTGGGGGGYTSGSSLSPTPKIAGATTSADPTTCSNLAHYHVSTAAPEKEERVRSYSATRKPLNSSTPNAAYSSFKENNPLQKSQTYVSAYAYVSPNRGISTSTAMPPASYKQRPFSEHIDPEQIDAFERYKLSKTPSFCYGLTRQPAKPTTNEDNQSKPSSSFATPLKPLRKNRNEVPPSVSASTENLRSEARARARLKSNSELGLSPEEKMQLLRKRLYEEHLNAKSTTSASANVSPTKHATPDSTQVERDHKMSASKSVNDLAFGQQQRMLADENMKGKAASADFTTDPCLLVAPNAANAANASKQAAAATKSKSTRRPKDPERRKSLIKSLSSFFHMGSSSSSSAAAAATSSSHNNHKDKNGGGAGHSAQTERPGTSGSSSTASGSNDGVFSLFRISPKHKSKDKDGCPIASGTAALHERTTSQDSIHTNKKVSTQQQQQQSNSKTNKHNNNNNSSNPKKHTNTRTATGFSSSSPQLYMPKSTKTTSDTTAAEQMPPPIPPLPLNYQRSDDESYATETRDQKKQRAISKAVRQAELKRLRIAQEIQREQEEIEVQLKELEARGVHIEKALRGEGPNAETSDNIGHNDEKLLKELLEIWRNITQLKKRDEELGIRQQELQLEHRHAQLKEELNLRLSSNKLDKSSADVAAEGAILNEMLEIVAKRAALRPTTSNLDLTTTAEQFGSDTAVTLQAARGQSLDIDESNI